MKRSLAVLLLFLLSSYAFAQPVETETLEDSATTSVRSLTTEIPARTGIRGDGAGLVMLPDTVDFGDVPVGGNYFGKFVFFQNLTGGRVTINTPYIGGQEGNPFVWFSNLIGQFSIGDSSIVTYGLRFRPPWTGSFEDVLCVPVTEEPNPCVRIRGRGTDAVEVPIFQGETTSTVVYLPNPGYETLDVRIRADQPWLTPLPSFALIQPGDSLAVTLAFNALNLASGSYQGTLSVEAIGTYFDYTLPVTLVVGDPVAEEEGGQDVRASVGTPYPNPAKAATRLPLVLDVPAVVAVEVFDLYGRRIRERTPVMLGTGMHELVMERRDLPTGVYYLRVYIRSETLGMQRTEVRRVVFVR